MAVMLRGCKDNCKLLWIWSPCIKQVWIHCWLNTPCRPCTSGCTLSSPSELLCKYNCCMMASEITTKHYLWVDGISFFKNGINAVCVASHWHLRQCRSHQFLLSAVSHTHNTLTIRPQISQTTHPPLIEFNFTSYSNNLFPLIILSITLCSSLPIISKVKTKSPKMLHELI